jgi:hypothetical protein
LENDDRIISRDWSLYDTSHVVIRPGRLSPDQLQEGYFRVFREAYSKHGMNARLKETTSNRHFFVPMNFGFRDSINELYREHCIPPPQPALVAG